MITMLAEVSTTETLLVVSGIASAITAVIVGIYSMTRKSQERIVTISPDAATKDELQAQQDQLESLRLKQSSDVKELHNKIERGQETFNRHVVEINRELGSLTAETKQQSGLLMEINREVKKRNHP